MVAGDKVEFGRNPPLVVENLAGENQAPQIPNSALSLLRTTQPVERESRPPAAGPPNLAGLRRTLRAKQQAANSLEFLVAQKSARLPPGIAAHFSAIFEAKFAQISPRCHGEEAAAFAAAMKATKEASEILAGRKEKLTGNFAKLEAAKSRLARANFLLLARVLGAGGVAGEYRQAALREIEASVFAEKLGVFELDLTHRLKELLARQANLPVVANFAEIPRLLATQSGTIEARLRASGAGTVEPRLAESLETELSGLVEKVERLNDFQPKKDETRMALEALERLEVSQDEEIRRLEDVLKLEIGKRRFMEEKRTKSLASTEL